MAYGLLTTGFAAKPLTVIQDEISADLKSLIAPTLDTSTTSALGQVVGVLSSQLRQLWELAEAVNAGQSPGSASGFSLTNVAALTGTRRLAATQSTTTITINIDPGTHAIGTLVAHVTDDPTARFSNSVAAVNSGGSPANVSVAFQAIDAGPVRANAGTLLVIAEAVSGWNSIVSHAADAVLGSDVESDSALRIRRELEIERMGSATADAIRVDLLDVVGVTFVTVLVNNTDVTDGEGIPPKSVEAVVLGGTDNAVATALWEVVAAGISTHGSTAEIVADNAGEHDVYFSRPDVINVYLELNITVDPDEFAGSDAVEAAIVDYGDTNLSVGFDVIVSRIVATAFGVGGVIDVTAVRAGRSASPTGTVNVVMGTREIADLDTARITLTITEAAGHP